MPLRSHQTTPLVKTKARIAPRVAPPSEFVSLGGCPRLRQETFPRAGDSGFRPCQGKLYQTRFDVRKGDAWKDGCPSLLEQLAIKKFQVILLELLLSAEEDVLGFGKALGLGQLGAGQFKGAGDVGNLEESVFGRFYSRDEFRSGGIDGKGLLEKRGELALAVVVIDLQFVVGIEFRCVGNQKLDDLLKQRVVDVLSAADEVLVNSKAFVGDVCVMQEKEHATEDASSRLSAHGFVILFTANKRSGMNTMVAVKPKGGKRIAELLNFLGEVNGLIMEHHADGIVARRAAVGVEAPRFVDKNADLLGAFVHNLVRFEITKARIASRLRQESFPRAGDSGFRPCRHIFYQNHAQYRNRVRRPILKEGSTVYV